MSSWLRKVCAVGLALGCGAALAAPAARSASTAARDLDSLEQRVQPCMACHGPEGRATSEGFYPRIAGKPAGYLFNQLVNFRTGRRRFPMMVYLTSLQEEPYLREIAGYFASQRLPYPPPAPPRVGSDVLARGRALVMHGDPARGVPSCRSCHGTHLLGVEPDVPGLLGLSRDYLVAQLTAWRIGARSAMPPDCMAEIVRRLRPDQVSAATAWLASQPVPPDTEPDQTFAHPPPLRCGSFATTVSGPAPAEGGQASAEGARASASGGPAPAPGGRAGANQTDAAGGQASSTREPVAGVLQRGRELVTLGGCHACHTALGGVPFAGGRAIPTPFGTFYSPNITPDPATGIGRWSADDFWRALHDGISRDGTPLYPAFPYTNYTRVTRADADAMFAYLKSLPAVSRANHPQEIRFPYDLRMLLAGWRFLYFKPGVYRSDPAHDAEWNRGAYLVEGLAHCSACHEARNALGATRSGGEPTGQLVLGWYAPSLRSSREAGVQRWPIEEIVTLLSSGVVSDPAAAEPSGSSSGDASSASHHAATMGPMAEVVHDSLQYAEPADLRAMAVYLRSLPDEKRPEPQVAPEVLGELRALREYGRKIYASRCAQCHGDTGQGRPPAGPPLAGDRVVQMPEAADPIRILLFGGYPPGTRGDPRPYGMPPFYPTLSDDQLADVLTYIRTSWGNSAPPVFTDEVAESRGNPLW